MSSYDPAAHGANCSACPLRDAREGGPIRPELKDAPTLIVGEFPGSEEVESGRLFVGQSGGELMRSLASQGIGRDQVSLTASVLCRPPSNDMKKFLGGIRKQNRGREAKGLPVIPTPQECCTPRVAKEVAEHSSVITLGEAAFKAVTGRVASLQESRGSALTLPSGVKVLPTLSPGFVMRKRRWTHAFRTDLGRAFRWFGDSLQWQPPEVNIAPTVDDVNAFLHQGAPFYVYDVETLDRNLETENYDPLTDILTCIGIGTPLGAIVIPFRFRTGQRGTYTPDETLLLQALLVDFFTDRSRIKVGHNAGAYDRQVVERTFGVTPRPLVDTILLHRVVESELPHNLGYIGSVYTDVHNWKQDHRNNEEETEEQYRAYCATDCVVTARITPTLIAGMELRQQRQVVEQDHQVQKLCAGMHRVGLYVDQERRHQWETKLRTACLERERECRDLVGRDDFNPNSPAQVQGVLFDKWGLIPLEYTETGDPSVDDDTLRHYLTSPLVSAERKRFLDSLRRYKRARKFLGTYVEPLRTWDDPREPGRVFPDGRVHPHYLCHGTVSGRLSSSGPNAQNFPVVLRDMIRAKPGNVIVGADADQLELRIAAALAGAKMYLEVFRQGGDPHAITAAMVFPDFVNHEKDSPLWVNYRNFAKTFVYAVLYGAQVPKVHEILTSTEDKRTGTLPYADLRIDAVRDRRDNWLNGSPEVGAWWESVTNEFREQSFLTDPILGRRRDFLDGPDAPEIINYKPQAAGSALMNRAALRIVEEIPFEAYGPGTGLINSMHDAVYVEVPADKADHAATVIKEAMNFVALDVPFTSKPKVSIRWNGEAA